MAGSDEDQTAKRRTDSKFYRRQPGLGWLLAFLASSSCKWGTACQPLAMNHSFRMLYGFPSTSSTKFISSFAEEML